MIQSYQQTPNSIKGYCGWWTKLHCHAVDFSSDFRRQLDEVAVVRCAIEHVFNHVRNVLRLAAKGADGVRHTQFIKERTQQLDAFHSSHFRMLEIVLAAKDAGCKLDELFRSLCLDGILHPVREQQI